MKNFAKVVLSWAFGNWLWSVMPTALGILSGGIVGKKSHVSDLWTYVLAIGVGLTVMCVAAILIRVAVNRSPRFAEIVNTTPSEAKRESQLQKLRLVRGEIEVGRRILERSVPLRETYELVHSDNWFAHRNEVAAVPEAGDAHLLAVEAWDGFTQYNEAVNKRSFISREDMNEIARVAQKAVDSLGIADKAVARR